MKPVILLDMDRMLYNTDQFMADLRRLLQQRFAVDPAKFTSSYTDHCVYNGEMRHYDFFAHMRHYKLDEDAVERAIEVGLSGREYVYPDVPAFLQFIKPRAGQLVVLTHGEHRFQYLKYSLSPALQGLRFKAVLAHKREYIAERFAGQQGYLIDDHQVGQLPQGFSHIWLSRYGVEGAYHSLDAVQNLLAQ